MEVVCPQQNISYFIPFEVIYKDIVRSIMKINLNFPTLANVSTSQLPDKIKVRILERVNVLKKTVQTILLEDTETEANLPP
jgi:hypothetical protein